MRLKQHHNKSRRPAAGREHIVEGVISLHRAGYGFLRVPQQTESVFLPAVELRGVMHGDRLKVSVSKDATGRWLGALLEIIERSVKTFLGTVEKTAGVVWVAALDSRLAVRCKVDTRDLKNAQAGDWVLARITQHASNGGVTHARIEKRLDRNQPLQIAVESAVARWDLPQDFSAAALAEARAFGEVVDSEEISKRIDLRHLPLVTIDGEDARDFDDAVYAEPLGKGYRLWVAIADVSHYVSSGSALDIDAVARGTSVYFPQRVLPMLPPALSDHLCSLAPHVARLCFVAELTISAQGAIQAAKFYPAVMRSAARLTYRLVHEALFARKVAARRELDQLALAEHPALSEKLQVLPEVYRALLKARARRGALDFDAPEAYIVLDAQKQVQAIELRERNEAHKMIEECMIAANVAVAKELQRKRTATLYRVHSQPDEKKIAKMVATLSALGIHAQLPETIHTRDLKSITQRLAHRPEQAFIESLVVRAMPQAVYQPENLGHFGLALPHYTHFTSPIRRYPDLVVHRCLKAQPQRLPQLQQQGEQLSQLERRADEASRYVNTYLKCSYLQAHCGETFAGLITSVVEFGCFVQILQVGIDGLLHLDALRDDDYRMSEDGQAWLGRQRGKRLRVGDTLQVVVVAVKPVEGMVDLALVSAT